MVVGGGEPAAEKAAQLLAARAEVRLIAPRVVPALAALAVAGRLTQRPRPYRRGDLAGAWLAVSTLADPAVNDALRAEALDRRIPLNVLDDPPRCSFIAPAVVRRGDLVVAVSTGGRAPALAVRLRERLERELGPEYARFLELAGSLRAALAARWPEREGRRALWYRLVDSDVLDLLRGGDEPAARRRMAEMLGVAVEGA